jgi:hypothetical protein
MCVFKREIDGQQRGCRFSETENFLDKVLVDNDGFCIFHSENEVWKNENNFNLYVDKVIRYFEAAPTEESIFLEDVVFTGNTEKLFSNKEFKKNIILKYSQFKEPLIIKSSTFKNINFKSSIFYKAVSFSAISIKEATFDCAQFKATVHIDKCDFHQNFFMVKTLFSGGLSISNSSFF